MRINQECWCGVLVGSLSLFVGALAVLTPSAVSADWLVTRDGAIIAIAGGWEIEDDLVTFHLPSGTYASLRRAEVDLEASHELTRKRTENAQQAKPQEPARRTATFVVTDADVYNPPPVAAPEVELEESTDPAGVLESSEVAEREALQVVEWREEIDVSAAALEIRGTVENGGPNPVTSVLIDVRLVDLDGTVLATSSARLDRPFLVPGTSTEFRASFPGVWSYDRAEFEIRSRGFVNHPGATN